MRIIDCIQGSPQWFKAREGIPTASMFKKIITPKTRKLAAGRWSYIDVLRVTRHFTAERFSQLPCIERTMAL